ncbi:MAG TPA: hypothetical protein VLY04_13915 [Bryobacteraceae bacterium]|nr:hypothetical protein [Bryobacteraceae bacterium]
MARNDKTGEPPASHGEWEAVHDALVVAGKMANAAMLAVRSLQHVVNIRHVSTDPRTKLALSPEQAKVLNFLRAQFRVSEPDPDPQEVLNVTTAYERISKRLITLSRNSFRMVTGAVAQQVAGNAGGDTFGYVVDEHPDTIYLNETYFSTTGSGRELPGPQPRSLPKPGMGPGKGVVTTPAEGMHILYSLSFRAGVILHEAVHLTYPSEGPVHRAIRGGAKIQEDDNGAVGFPQVKSYLQAIGEAYVYERFAAAVYNATP